jgi:peptide-methionine (S)-S-oxide reductase
VCSGHTGPTAAVLAVLDPLVIPYHRLLQLSLLHHDPPHGMRHLIVFSAKETSVIYTFDDEQLEAAKRSRDMYQEVLRGAGYGDITTEIRPVGTFFYAEDYHQQYLAKNPGGYCGLGGTGLSCPVGLAETG